jgi:hypothetical protein
LCLTFFLLRNNAFDKTLNRERPSNGKLPSNPNMAIPLFMLKLSIGFCNPELDHWFNELQQTRRFRAKQQLAKDDGRLVHVTVP